MTGFCVLTTSTAAFGVLVGGTVVGVVIGCINGLSTGGTAISKFYGHFTTVNVSYIRMISLPVCEAYGYGPGGRP